MDDFSLDRPELSGTVMSLEFGSGGRIHQLWIDDPNGEGDADGLQLILPPLSLNDEFVDDYLPGAILIGARTRPDDPWIVSRNTDARILGEAEELLQITFEYEFSLLPEVYATGHFFERPGPVPHIVWDVTIENRGKVSLEIGELGFPFALNNLYRTYSPDLKGRRAMMDENVTIHPCLAGAASYFHAQRLNGTAPGLVIAPGDDTVWEAYNSVPSTLRGPEPWPGIPVAYIYSRATVDREGWAEWFNGHSSLVMEPGESHRYRTLLIPTDSGDAEGALSALAAVGQPTIGLWPGAVAPADVGILVQIAGATPTQVKSDPEADLEADSEEGRGSCQVTPKQPGPVRFSFEDTEGRTSWAHLLFTEPIETLIKRRAKWIVDHQVVQGGPFDGAIMMANLETGAVITDIEDFQTPFGLESSLSDALFLAEKNTRYPVASEMAALKQYMGFIGRRVQNPSTLQVGFAFESLTSPAIISSSSKVSMLLSMLQMTYGEALGGDAKQQWLEHAFKTARAGLAKSGSHTSPPSALDLRRRIELRIAELSRAAATTEEWGPERSDRDRWLAWEGHESNIFQLVYAHRSLAPCWWWYGSDSGVAMNPMNRNRAAIDKGEMCLGPTTTQHAHFALKFLEHDRPILPVGALRMAFGGLLGVWALVRADGAAAAGFCPDLASEQYGMSPITGTVGLTLYHYLRQACAYVDPTTDLSFGCFHSQEKEWSKVTPWDGVGRRIVVRAYGLVLETEFGCIRELRFKRDRSEAVIKLENPAAEARTLRGRIRGLWGTRARVNGEAVDSEDGWIAIEVSCEGEATAIAEIRIQK